MTVRDYKKYELPPVVYPEQKPGPVKRGDRGRCLLPDTWVLVSNRTLGGRYAFLPLDEHFTERVWGIIGTAQGRYGVDISAFVLVGNHFHGMVRARRPAAISLFMQYVASRLAELTNELNGTLGGVWDDRYGSTNLLDDEAEARWFKYLLAHMTKERILPSPTQWTGPQVASAVTTGEALAGSWLDRAAWKRAKEPDDKRPFLRPTQVTLTPLTRWEGADPSTWRTWCQEALTEIVAEHAEADFVGLRQTLALGALYRPTQLKRSICRTFDARGEDSRALLAEAYAGRREGLATVSELRRRITRIGHAVVIRAEGAEVPHGFDWPPGVLDAIEDRAIAGQLRHAELRDSA